LITPVTTGFWWTDPQVGAIFTLGADEAALPGEIAITREVVKEALERLASALLQALIQDAVLIAVDHINQAIGNLLTAGLNVKMEVDSLNPGCAQRGLGDPGAC
jgi:hypothetical protein